MTYTITAAGLRQRFGEEEALRGVDLWVEEGSVLALLGRNGAGKTTTVRILTTQLRPTAGRATVAGHDVVAAPDAVRRSIGLAGQHAAVDERLSGFENLELIGRLGQLPRRVARRRADDLLERFGLADVAHRTVRTYSGGMRRRVDLAAALVAAPPVLFLDEPTTGLDPVARRGLWEAVEDLVAGGTTLLLTTQYLEEAHRLADRVALVDRGRIVAEGTAAELTAAVGDEVLELTLAPGTAASAAAALAGHVSDVDAAVEDGRLVVRAPDLSASLLPVLRAVSDVAGPPADVGLRGPTLDDAFLALTGQDVVPGPDTTDHAAAATDRALTSIGAA